MESTGRGGKDTLSPDADGSAQEEPAPPPGAPTLCSELGGRRADPGRLTQARQREVSGCDRGGVGTDRATVEIHTQKRNKSIIGLFGRYELEATAVHRVNEPLAVPGDRLEPDQGNER